MTEINKGEAPINLGLPGFDTANKSPENTPQSIVDQHIPRPAPRPSVDLRISTLQNQIDALIADKDRLDSQPTDFLDTQLRNARRDMESLIREQNILKNSINAINEGRYFDAVRVPDDIDSNVMQFPITSDISHADQMMHRGIATERYDFMPSSNEERANREIVFRRREQRKLQEKTKPKRRKKY